MKGAFSQTLFSGDLTLSEKPKLANYMKILLVFEDKFPIDKEKFIKLIQEKSKFIEVELYASKFVLQNGLITKPKTFTNVEKKIKKVINNYDGILCFTEKQYDDNFFFYGFGKITIISFYAWSYLTSLPMSNGVLYFMIENISLDIDHTSFRHTEETGCLYDFKGDKRTVDHGMRQAGFCANCLKRISESLITENEFKIFDDLQILMDHLSSASRWNKDILLDTKVKSNSIGKRKPKNKEGVTVVIASAGDTIAERKMLLDTLEVKFRRDNHEANCGFRIIVTGWEDLASQPGYAQDVINEKIISESDFVVAVFRHKLGTPTKNVLTGKKRAESGTAEELLQALDKSKPNHPIGMAYFFSPAPLVSLDNPDKAKIEADWIRLSEFKDSIKEKMIYKPYTDNNELVSFVLKDLEKNIKDYIQK